DLVRPFDETIAANAVEPFDLHRLELTGRLCQRASIGAFAGGNGGSRRLRQCRTQVDRQYAPGLQPALEPHWNAFDGRAFGHASAPVVAKHAEVQENVAFDVVADQEAEPAGRVEPLHATGDRRHLRVRRYRDRIAFSQTSP